MEVFFEFIRTDIAAKFSHPTIEKQGMLSDDKVGVDRLVEALQCNMWPNMIRKPMDDVKAQIKQNLNQEMCEEEKEIPQGTEPSKGNPSTKSTTKESDPVNISPLNPVLPIPDYSNSTAHGTDPNNFEEEERNLEELGSLMVQMKNLKDSVQGMTLDERRNNAEEMIK